MDVREYARSLARSPARRRYFVNPDEMDGPRRRSPLVSKDARVVRACENAECLVSWRQFLADISRRHAYRAQDRRSSEASQNHGSMLRRGEWSATSVFMSRRKSFMINWLKMFLFYVQIAFLLLNVQTLRCYQISFVKKRKGLKRTDWNIILPEATRQRWMKPILISLRYLG
jgi:hypothetical protein